MTERFDVIQQIQMNLNEQIRVCSLSSQYGKLNVLRWAHEHHFAWNVWTCSYAAENGYLDCLKYAHEHGCPWDKDTCSYVAEN